MSTANEPRLALFVQLVFQELGRNERHFPGSQWLVAQLVTQLGKTPAARIAMLALQPPETPGWDELLEAHVRSTLQLPNPFGVIEDTIAMLNGLPAGHAIQMAVALLRGELYLFRPTGDRTQNHALALASLQQGLRLTLQVGDRETFKISRERERERRGASKCHH